MSRPVDTVLLRLDAELQPVGLAYRVRGERAFRMADPESRLSAEHTLAVAATPQIRLGQVDLPARNRERFREAVAFALEESLLGEVERLHFALPERLSGTRCDVAWVEREWLQARLATLAAAGHRLDLLIPEPLLLPQDCGLLDGGLLSFRQRDAAGVGEAQWLLPAIEHELNRLLAGSRTLHAPESAERIGDPLEWLARDWPARPPLNLLTGPFAPQGSTGPSRAHRIAAGLAGLAALTGVAGQFVDTAQARRQQASMEAAVIAELKLLEGSEARISADPLRQLRASIAARAGRAGAAGAGPLALLAVAGPVLATESRLELAGLEWRDEQLTLSYRAPDLSTLEQLVQRLQQSPDLLAELSDTRFESGRSTGRIKLRMRRL
ncbi:MAG: type II secretion system protein GspL [Xanthomonadales bacterium]|jgi:general secretion pathway protein L|nr:type II secretion system protein GspL [Xanthomonadales bacterium]